MAAKLLQRPSRPPSFFAPVLLGVEVQGLGPWRGFGGSAPRACFFTAPLAAQLADPASALFREVDAAWGKGGLQHRDGQVGVTFAAHE